MISRIQTLKDSVITIDEINDKGECLSRDRKPSEGNPSYLFRKALDDV